MSKIIGYGCAQPSRLVTNDELTKLFETSDEWIRTRTGIVTRNINQGGNTDMAFEAAQAALKDAKMDIDEIDYIVTSNMSPDDIVVSTSAQVMVRFGSRNIPCVDINAACSGFIYGVDIVDSLLKSGKYKNILLISSEMVSRITNWEDRKTAVLFGDAAGAVVMQASDKDHLTHIEISAKKAEYGVLDCPNVYRGFEFRKEDKFGEGHIEMEGTKVFKFAVSTVSREIESVLEKSGLTIDDVDYVVAHQANERILESIAKKINCPMDKFFINLGKWGNTSSATIPVALAEMKEQGLLKPGQKIILAGFGAGLTWGTALLEV